jgi:hypothetical protein
MTVVRADLKPGAQIAQTGHAIAEFAHQFPNQFHDWKRNSNYLISLSIDNEEKLQRLFYKLQDNGADVVAFTEPDINDQLTAICYYGTPEMRKHTDKLDLALENQCYN